MNMQIIFIAYILMDGLCDFVYFYLGKNVFALTVTSILVINS